MRVRKLRAAGRLPAVIYGRQTQAQNLEIDATELEEVIQHSASENILVELSIKDDPKPKRLALVQEVQHHSLSGQVLHLDLHEVAEDEKVTLMVPVETTGEAVGVKTGGGVLEHVLFRIKVRALPKDLPELLTLDVTHLEIGQSIHIGDVQPPPGVEILGDRNISVISVAAPITEAQETAALEGAVTPLAEPEVIKEKKEEEGVPAPAEKGAAKAPEKGAEKTEKKPEKK